VEVAFIGEVLSGGEGETGGDDTFDCGIVGEVEEQYDSLH